MARNRHSNGKAKNLRLTWEYLDDRSRQLAKKGWSEPKWIGFSKALIAHGLTLHLYEAIRTVSKYITVTNGSGRTFKVRFSNHKPINQRELAGDCDFFVGVTNLSTTNTEQAFDATLEFFGLSEVAGNGADVEVLDEGDRAW